MMLARRTAGFNAESRVHTLFRKRTHTQSNELPIERPSFRRIRYRPLRSDLFLGAASLGRCERFRTAAWGWHNRLTLTNTALQTCWRGAVRLRSYYTFRK